MKQPSPPEVTPIGKAILDYLNAHPEGEKTVRIAQAIGTTHQVTQRYLYRLRTRKLVRLEGRKPHYWYLQNERKDEEDDRS